MNIKNTIIAVTACLVAFCAKPDEYVYSENTHAIVKVDTVSTNVLIAVPWTFYTPDNSATTNLPINRLVKPECLDDGDLLLNVTQTNPQKYQAWMLVKENGIGAWMPTISVDKSNPEMKSVSWEVPNAVTSAELPIPRGIGLWVIRTNPKDNAGNWKPIFLYGQWAKSPAKVEVLGGIGMTNAVMIAQPDCSRSTSINEDMTWDFVGNKDTLSVPNGTDAWDLCLWDATEGKWYTSGTKDVEMKIGTKIRIMHQTYRVYDISVPPGRGFWYIRRDVDGNCVINWN